MSEALLTRLLPALDLAVFVRGDDGAFTAMAPPPPWFPRLADGTFPFLGHILEEANEFWRSGATGSREFGPAAERDESGREFHYRVRAITLGQSFAQFLVFELDAGSERLREALQKAREQALVVEQKGPLQRRAAADVRRAASELQELVDQLSTMTASDRQPDLLRAIQAKCELLLASSRAIAE